MKIDMPVAPLDKDGASRTLAKGNGKDFGTLSAAFDKAVREVGGQDAADTKRKTTGTDTVEANTDDEAADAAAEGMDAASETDADAGNGTQTTAELRSLQSLLGVFGAPGAKPKNEPQPDDKGEVAKGTVSMPDAALDAAASEGVTEVKNGGGMRLDVLKMETHFEPRQDGMVLVRPTVEADTAEATTQAEKTTTRNAIADLLPKAADNAPTKSAGTDATASVRISFDEAVAQLGQGGREPSGERGSRGGASAGAQSTLSELSGARSAAKAADAVVSVSTSASTTVTTGTSPFGLLDQVAGPILQALGDGGSSAAASSAPTTDAHLRMRAGGGALKTLTIQLHPEHLGTVDVSLRLNEGQLTIELAASQSDTAAMLLDDRASLRKLLEHAGFSLDDAAISVVTRDSTMTRAADSTDTGAQSRNSSSGSSSDNQRAPERDASGSSGDQSERRRTPARQAVDTPAASARSGSTYL